MESPDARRSRTSLRLKAGRHLAAARESQRKKAKTVADVAKHPLLVDNNITANRLEEIEQRKTDARPMELEKIATALGLPADWFVRADPVRRAADPFDELERALADLGLVLGPWQAAEPSDERDTGHEGEGLGDGDA